MDVTFKSVLKNTRQYFQRVPSTESSDSHVTSGSQPRFSSPQMYHQSNIVNPYGHHQSASRHHRDFSPGRGTWPTPSPPVSSSVSNQSSFHYSNVYYPPNNVQREHQQLLLQSSSSSSPLQQQQQQGRHSKTFPVNSIKTTDVVTMSSLTSSVIARSLSFPYDNTDDVDGAIQQRNNVLSVSEISAFKKQQNYHNRRESPPSVNHQQYLPPQPSQPPPPPPSALPLNSCYRIPSPQRTLPHVPRPEQQTQSHQSQRQPSPHLTVHNNHAYAPLANNGNSNNGIVVTRYKHPPSSSPLSEYLSGQRGMYDMDSVISQPSSSIAQQRNNNNNNNNNKSSSSSKTNRTTTPTTGDGIQFRFQHDRCSDNDRTVHFRSMKVPSPVKHTAHPSGAEQQIHSIPNDHFAVASGYTKQASYHHSRGNPNYEVEDKPANVVKDSSSSSNGSRKQRNNAVYNYDNHRTTNSSDQRAEHSESILGKRESPLDLSVKTVRQSADSTALDDHDNITFVNGSGVVISRLNPNHQQSHSTTSNQHFEVRHSHLPQLPLRVPNSTYRSLSSINGNSPFQHSATPNNANNASLYKYHKVTNDTIDRRDDSSRPSVPTNNTPPQNIDLKTGSSRYFPDVPTNGGDFVKQRNYQYDNNIAINKIPNHHYEIASRSSPVIVKDSSRTESPPNKSYSPLRSSPLPNSDYRKRPATSKIESNSPSKLLRTESWRATIDKEIENRFQSYITKTAQQAAASVNNKIHNNSNINNNNNKDVIREESSRKNSPDERAFRNDNDNYIPTADSRNVINLLKNNLQIKEKALLQKRQLLEQQEQQQLYQTQQMQYHQSYPQQMKHQPTERAEHFQQIRCQQQFEQQSRHATPPISTDSAFSRYSRSQGTSISTLSPSRHSRSPTSSSPVISVTIATTLPQQQQTPFWHQRNRPHNDNDVSNRDESSSPIPSRTTTHCPTTTIASIATEEQSPSRIDEYTYPRKCSTTNTVVPLPPFEQIPVKLNFNTLTQQQPPSQDYSSFNTTDIPIKNNYARKDDIVQSRKNSALSSMVLSSDIQTAERIIRNERYTSSVTFPNQETTMANNLNPPRRIRTKAELKQVPFLLASNEEFAPGNDHNKDNDGIMAPPIHFTPKTIIKSEEFVLPVARTPDLDDNFDPVMPDNARITTPILLSGGHVNNSGSVDVDKSIPLRKRLYNRPEEIDVSIASNSSFDRITFNAPGTECELHVKTLNENTNDGLINDIGSTAQKYQTESSPIVKHQQSICENDGEKRSLTSGDDDSFWENACDQLVQQLSTNISSSTTKRGRKKNSQNVTTTTTVERVKVKKNTNQQTTIKKKSSSEEKSNDDNRSNDNRNNKEIISKDADNNNRSTKIKSCLTLAEQSKTENVVASSTTIPNRTDDAKTIKVEQRPKKEEDVTTIMSKEKPNTPSVVNKTINKNRKDDEEKEIRADNRSEEIVDTTLKRSSRGGTRCRVQNYWEDNILDSDEEDILLKKRKTKKVSDIKTNATANTTSSTGGSSATKRKVDNRSTARKETKKNIRDKSNLKKTSKVDDDQQRDDDVKLKKFASTKNVSLCGSNKTKILTKDNSTNSDNKNSEVKKDSNNNNNNNHGQAKTKKLNKTAVKKTATNNNNNNNNNTSNVVDNDIVVKSKKTIEGDNNRNVKNSTTSGSGVVKNKPDLKRLTTTGGRRNNLKMNNKPSTKKKQQQEVNKAEKPDGKVAMVNDKRKLRSRDVIITKRNVTSENSFRNDNDNDNDTTATVTKQRLQPQRSNNSNNNNNNKSNSNSSARKTRSTSTNKNQLKKINNNNSNEIVSKKKVAKLIANNDKKKSSDSKNGPAISDDNKYVVVEQSSEMMKKRPQDANRNKSVVVNNWEEELFYYKFSLRTPLKLINLSKPSNWPRSDSTFSLPDLDRIKPNFLLTNRYSKAINNFVVNNNRNDNNNNKELAAKKNDKRNAKNSNVKKAKNTFFPDKPINTLLINEPSPSSVARNRSNELIIRSSATLDDFPNDDINEFDIDRLLNDPFVGFFRQETVQEYKEIFEKRNDRLVEKYGADKTADNANKSESDKNNERYQSRPNRIRRFDMIKRILSADRRRPASAPPDPSRTSPYPSLNKTASFLSSKNSGKKNNDDNNNNNNNNNDNNSNNNNDNNNHTTNYNGSNKTKNNKNNNGNNNDNNNSSSKTKNNDEDTSKKRKTLPFVKTETNNNNSSCSDNGSLNGDIKPVLRDLARLRNRLLRKRCARKNFFLEREQREDIIRLEHSVDSVCKLEDMLKSSYTEIDIPVVATTALLSSTIDTTDTKTTNNNNNKIKNNSNMKKKNRTVRRKCKSSGFDYIRKKKKQQKTSPVTNARLGKDEAEDHRNEDKKKAVPRPNRECVEDIQNEIRSWVVNKGIGETVLHRAARLGYCDISLYCLEKLEYSPSAADNAGYTPLHEACTKGHMGIAKLLLMHGADVSASAKGGIRPLHEAVEFGDLEIIRLLLSYGADPLLATYSGQTPISLVKDEHEHIKEFLLLYLADIEGFPAEPWFFTGYNTFDPAQHGYDPLADPPSLECCSSDDLEMEYCNAALPTLYRLGKRPEFWVVLMELPPRIREVVKKCVDDKKGPKFNSELVDEDSFENNVRCVCFMERRYRRSSSTTSSTITLIEYTDELKNLLKIGKLTLPPSFAVSTFDDHSFFGNDII